MEKRILEYERFIRTETGKDLSEKQLEALRRYHAEMMDDFQKERICHLLVTFFFVLMTIGSLLLTAEFIYSFCFVCIPKYFVVLVSVLSLILVVLTFFYVKHYYFLENHIQELYKYSKKIYNKK